MDDKYAVPNKPNFYKGKVPFTSPDDFVKQRIGLPAFVETIKIWARCLNYRKINQKVILEYMTYGPGRVIYDTMEIINYYRQNDFTRLETETYYDLCREYMEQVSEYIYQEAFQ